MLSLIVSPYLIIRTSLFSMTMELWHLLLSILYYDSFELFYLNSSIFANFDKISLV